MGRKKGTAEMDNVVIKAAAVDAVMAQGNAMCQEEAGGVDDAFDSGMKANGTADDLYPRMEADGAADNLYSGMETDGTENVLESGADSGPENDLYPDTESGGFESDEFWSNDGQSTETEYEDGEAGEDEDFLPELTEDDIFGEDLDYGEMEEIGGTAGGGAMKADEGAAGTGEESGAGGHITTEAAENAAESKEASADMEAWAEPAPAKPKRTSRKRKMETADETVKDGADASGQKAGEEQAGGAASLDLHREESAVMEEGGQAGVETDPETDGDSDRELYPDLEESENVMEDDDMLEEKPDEADGDISADGKGQAAGETAEEKISASGSTGTGSRRSSRTKKTEAPVLTLEVRGEVETEEAREDAIWHEIHNAYRTRRILTGQLGGIEQSDNGKTIAIVDYKGFRIVIPLKEMMINVGRSPSGQEYAELMLRQNKILGNMLGAEIDFTVRGIDSKTRSVVASRREAMLKKRQIFYLDKDAAGMHRIYEGRIVQARVVAVAEKVLRVEVFGVECSIMARDLAWDWIGDAHERFSVGDQVLVRVLSVRRDSLEEVAVKADIKSVSQNTSYDNLKKCRIQSKYAGKVTDIHKGVVYIRLSNGVNAVAHSCYDYRMPGKKDDVSFAVTRLDEERGVAVGIITRIIRQNL